MMIFLKMRLDPQGRGAVFIAIVNVVDNDDDNEFVNVAFFSENPIFWVSILTLLPGK
jgi:hypothetical protein